MIDSKILTKDLKPCPFCGGKARIIKCHQNFPPIPRTHYYIKCERCKVHSFPWDTGNYYNSDKKDFSDYCTDDVIISILVKRWNNRIKINQREGNKDDTE